MGNKPHLLSELCARVRDSGDDPSMVTFVNKSIRELHGHLSQAMIAVFDSMRTATPACVDALVMVARLLAEAEQELKSLANAEHASSGS